MAQAVVRTTGEVPIEGRAAVPVYVDDTLPAVGPARNVFVVTSGPIAGGPPLAVRDMTGVLPGIGPALPVYVISGSLGSAAAPTYTQKVQASGPIAYWPLAEGSGSVANDESGNGRNGAYTSVTLGQTGIGDGRTAASFDGTASFCTIYSASLNGAFNGQEGTLALWARVSGAGVWADGAVRVASQLRVDGSNILSIQRNGLANQLDFFYIAGGTTKQVTVTIGPTTDWFHVALTWSKSADQMKAYVGGVQSGSTQTALGAWAGALLSTHCNIGCRNNSIPDQVWSGFVAHAAIWTTALSAAQIAALATVP